MIEKIDIIADLDQIKDLGNGDFQIRIDPLNRAELYPGKKIILGNQIKSRLYTIIKIEVLNDYYLLVRESN